MINPDAAGVERLEVSDLELAKEALAILDRNWLGHATRPGRLYPHQWSWDAACIAMGRAAWDQGRAEQELRSLFAGQWDNGLLPHIVFTDADRYFPGREFWQTERAAAAPRSPHTSGIVQPPIHATAAWRLFCRAPDRSGAKQLLVELFPGLVAWHGYLYRERTRDGEGLAEVWHPWEAGMDNSPAWDGALARIVLTPEQIPSYERVDNRIGDPGERPSDFDYDRYSYLVARMQELSYDPASIRAECPFAIQPALFNSLLVQSNRDLAQIACVVGEDPEPYQAWADLTAGALEKLWDEERRFYFDFDLRAGTWVSAATAAGFAPLYAGALSVERAIMVVDSLVRFSSELGEDGLALSCVGHDDPDFRPRLYWRGPVWPIIHWVVSAGLRRYGYTQLADRVSRTAIELVRNGGFWEHYNPLTGDGQGDPSFSWTAGLVLDMLDAPPSAEEDRR